MSLRVALVSLLVACGQVDHADAPDASPPDGPPAGSLAVTVDPAPRFVRVGADATIDVALARDGVAGPVTVTLAPLAGVTVDPLVVDGDAGQLHLHVAGDAPFARAALELTAAADGAVAHAPVALELIGIAGTLDPTFGGGGVAPITPATGVAVPLFAIPQGDRVVVGVITSRANGQGVLVVRFDRNGALDPSFAGGEVFLDPATIGLTGFNTARAVAQADGRIVIAGSGTASSGDSDPFVVRLTPDGGADSSLPLRRVDTSTSVISIGAVTVGPAGELVLGGSRRQSQSADALLIRLDASGARDPGFGANGIATFDANVFDEVSGLVVQADGRVVAMIDSSGGGSFELPVYALRRFGTDGVLDATFGDSGKAALPTPEGNAAGPVLVSPDRLNLLVGGAVRTTFVGGDLAVWRFLADGRLDLGFGGGLGYYAAPASDNVDGIAQVLPAPDGTIYAIGTESASFSPAGIDLLHFDAAGNLDPSFGTAGIAHDPTPVGASGGALRADHRIVATTANLFTSGSATVRTYWQ